MCWFSIFHFEFYAALTSLIPRPFSDFVSQSWKKKFLYDCEIKSGNKVELSDCVHWTSLVHKQIKGYAFSKSISLWSVRLGYFCVYLFLAATSCTSMCTWNLSLLATLHCGQLVCILSKHRKLLVAEAVADSVTTCCPLVQFKTNWNAALYHKCTT